MLFRCSYCFLLLFLRLPIVYGYAITPTKERENNFLFFSPAELLHELCGDNDADAAFADTGEFTSEGGHRICYVACYIACYVTRVEARKRGCRPIKCISSDA